MSTSNQAVEAIFFAALEQPDAGAFGSNGHLVELLALRAVAPRAAAQRLCVFHAGRRSFRPLLRGRSSRSARTATTPVGHNFSSQLSEVLALASEPED
jgi:hypothetical protein